MAGAKKRSSRPVGETIGGILAGFDQQILRQTPPPHELVLKGTPIRGTSGEDGSSLVIDLPARDDEDPTASAIDDDVAGPRR